MNFSSAQSPAPSAPTRNEQEQERRDDRPAPLSVRSRVGEGLEERATKITSTATPWEASPGATIARQLALTLDEIRQVRGLHRQLEKRLLVQECYVDTDLLQPLQPAERAKLHGRLLTIEKERLRLVLTEQEQLRSLHERLLELLNKHAYLDHED